MKNNLFLTLFLSLILLVLVQVFLTGPRENIGFQGQEQLGHVVRIVDGDTVELLDGTIVRYLGINAPEKGDPWSAIATERNRQLVESKDVRLEFDFEKEDHYGRTLAYIYQDDTFINYELVKEGLAWAYPVDPNNYYAAEIKQAEADAKQDRAGVWSKITTYIHYRWGNIN